RTRPLLTWAGRCYSPMRALTTSTAPVRTGISHCSAVGYLLGGRRIGGGGAAFHWDVAGPLQLLAQQPGVARHTQRGHGQAVLTVHLSLPSVVRHPAATPRGIRSGAGGRFMAAVRLPAVVGRVRRPGRRGPRGGAAPGPPVAPGPPPAVVVRVRRPGRRGRRGGRSAAPARGRWPARRGR